MEAKKYIIAGASSGIGLETAKQLISLGHTVYGISRNSGELEDNDNYHFLNYDFLSGDLLPEIDEPIDGLVYCPGSITLKTFERLSDKDIENDYSINVLGAVKFIRKYLPNLKKQENGSIVLFSTVAVTTGLPYHASIAMAKGAVEGLTRSLAAELSPKIRVNCIAPSLTQTPLAGSLLNSESKMTANMERHPLKTIGKPGDIAAFTAFLLTDAAFATGQVFGLNGGLGTIIK